jgi:hypothetical protein
MGMPKRCVVPTTTSAPISPGGTSSVSASRSAAKTTAGLLRVDLLHVGAPVHDPAAAGGVLDQRAEHLAGQRVFPFLLRVGDHDADAQWRGARLDHFDRLRMAVAGHDEDFAAALHRAPQERHGFGGGRGFIEHRGVGDRHGR